MYRKANAPDEYQAGWLDQELSKLELAFSLLDFLPLKQWNVLPAKPRQGSLYYADGSNWNPGADEGLYFYDGTSFSPIGPIEFGDWTPTLTFGTPGNLAVNYAARIGEYEKLGNLVFVSFQITTSSFTHTTASGDALITGLPFPSASEMVRIGALRWQGITKAGYTDINTRLVQGGDNFTLAATGSGQPQTNVSAADMPSGGTVGLTSTVVYRW